MSNTPQSAGTTAVQASDRRAHFRQRVDSLSYIEMGTDNGGILLNLCEDGLALTSAVILTGEQSPRLRFRVPGSNYWIEATGNIVWTSKSRREAGLRFVDLRDDDRKRIRAWLASYRPAGAVSHSAPSIASSNGSQEMPAASQAAAESQGAFNERSAPASPPASPETIPQRNAGRHEPAPPRTLRIASALNIAAEEDRVETFEDDPSDLQRLAERAALKKQVADAERAAGNASSNVAGSPARAPSHGTSSAGTSPAGTSSAGTLDDPSGYLRRNPVVRESSDSAASLSSGRGAAPQGAYSDRSLSDRRLLTNRDVPYAGRDRRMGPTLTERRIAAALNAPPLASAAVELPELQPVPEPLPPPEVFSAPGPVEVFSAPVPPPSSAAASPVLGHIARPDASPEVQQPAFRRATETDNTVYIAPAANISARPAAPFRLSYPASESADSLTAADNQPARTAPLYLWLAAVMVVGIVALLSYAIGAASGRNVWDAARTMVTNMSGSSTGASHLPGPPPPANAGRMTSPADPALSSEKSGSERPGQRKPYSGGSVGGTAVGANAAENRPAGGREPDARQPVPQVLGSQPQGTQAQGTQSPAIQPPGTRLPGNPAAIDSTGAANNSAAAGAAVAPGREARSDSRPEARTTAPNASTPRVNPPVFPAGNVEASSQPSNSQAANSTTLGTQAPGSSAGTGQPANQQAPPVQAQAAQAAPQPLPTGTVEINSDPYPTVRVPPGRSLPTRPGTAFQIGPVVSRVEPVYPPEALRQHLEGTVRLHAIIRWDGVVDRIEVKAGSQLFVDAATTAVQQWRYKPTYIGDESVETEEDINITFRLAGTAPRTR